MALLVWDQVADRLYETGISKGVLYEPDGNGVVWNGLTSVEEDDNNEVEPVYFDGVKIDDVVTIGDFSGTLRAFTYPDEFLVYEGTIQDQTGFYLTGQPKSQFCLSYQTKIGNSVSGVDLGYKIHILYNLTAIPSTKTYKTMSLETDPIEFEWTLSSIPEDIENYRPTAHVIIDSRKFNSTKLAALGVILYGDSTHTAHLPTLQSLMTLLGS